MKRKPRISKKLMITVLITLLLIIPLIYLFMLIHESAHYAVCEAVDLNASYNISMQKNHFAVDCPTISQSTDFNKFLFWSMPYLVYLLVVSTFIFYRPKSLYFMAIPFAVFISAAGELIISLLRLNVTDFILMRANPYLPIMIAEVMLILIVFGYVLYKKVKEMIPR